MIVTLDTHRLQTLDQVREFLDGSREIDLRPQTLAETPDANLAYTLANIWQSLGITFRYMAQHRARYRPQP